VPVAPEDSRFYEPARSIRHRALLHEEMPLGDVEWTVKPDGVIKACGLQPFGPPKHAMGPHGRLENIQIRGERKRQLLLTQRGARATRYPQPYPLGCGHRRREAGWARLQLQDLDVICKGEFQFWPSEFADCARTFRRRFTPD